MEVEVMAPSVSLLEKLQLKDEKNILVQGLPSTVEKQFSKVTFAKNLTPLLRARKVDFALVFAINKNQLRDILKDVVPALHQNGKLWVAFPKLTSKIVSDLARDCSWDCVAQHGYESVRLINVDHVWSAMHFKKSSSLKVNTPRPVTVSETMAQAPRERAITVPVEIERFFLKNKKAAAFFESLSYMNRKEYVTWISSARRDETRNARIEATMEKLNNGKKSPAEK